MKESFDKYFLNRGGVLGYEDDKTRAFINLGNILVNDIRKQYPDLPNIYIGIVNNLSLNATAVLDKGKYYIGVNLGLLNSIEDIFFKIQSNKNFPLNNTISLSNSMHGPEYEFAADTYIMPFTKASLKVAVEQSNIVLKFILYHEICHILRGHLGLISSKNGSELQEAFQDESILNINLRQTLEMDADSFSVNRIINSYLLFYSNIENHSESIYQTWETFIYNFSFSIYTFFRLFGFHHVEVEKIKKFPHPRPLTRIQMISENIETILITREIDNLDYLCEKIVDAQVDAEKELTKVTFFSNETRDFLLAVSSDESRIYINKIISNWNKLYDDLLPYTFGVLPNKNAF